MLCSHFPGCRWPAGLNKQGMQKGCTHVYYGDGKGKTTAALGLSLRAAGAGLRVGFIQFLKGRATAEAHALASMQERILHRQFGTPEFITGAPSQADYDAARAGWHAVRTMVAHEELHVLVLDEMLDVMAHGLIAEAEVLDFISHKPAHLECVLTGHVVSDALVEAADLVTHMKQVKHYYHSGKRKTAREGIEC